MTQLPKKFPEYSLMYKTLNKKIQKLREGLPLTIDTSSRKKIQDEISIYQKELDRIKSFFPENFFEKNDK